MTQAYSQKASHSLFRCRDPEEFLARFEAECGQGVGEFVGKFVPPDRVAGTILVGSIPLGIGTPASDIDLLVVIDAPDALVAPERKEEGIVFSGDFGGADDKLAVAEVVALLSGVEVNVNFVLASRIQGLAHLVSGAGVSLNPQEVQILSRIKTGWVLAESPWLDDACGGLLSDDALEVHCAVRYFVFALGDLLDARAALGDHLPLASHLGRICVEKTFASYFASRGYAFLGSKWLRFLRHYTERGPGAGQPTLRELSEWGVSLMFPHREEDRGSVELYLNSVAEFVVSARRLIEEDVTFRIAFKVCPQIYDPSRAAVPVPPPEPAPAT